MTYDQWKLASPDDEAEAEQRRLRSKRDIWDEADERYQAMKDGDRPEQEPTT